MLCRDQLPHIQHGVTPQNKQICIILQASLYLALLYGPPGCGKTMLAKMVAAEAGMAFLYVSTAEIISMWQGESAKNVKAMFEVSFFTTKALN